MKMTMRWVLAAALLGLVAGCGGGTGVCTASGLGTTFCKDDWTEAECEEWDQEMVNASRWSFHGGQTCEERGTPATP